MFFWSGLRCELLRCEVRAWHAIFAEPGSCAFHERLICSQDERTIHYGDTVLVVSFAHHDTRLKGKVQLNRVAFFPFSPKCEVAILADFRPGLFTVDLDCGIFA